MARTHEQTESIASDLKFERYFTKNGVHPFDQISWENRDAAITDASGKTVFLQENV